MWMQLLTTCVAQAVVQGQAVPVEVTTMPITGISRQFHILLGILMMENATEKFLTTMMLIR